MPAARKSASKASKSNAAAKQKEKRGSGRRRAPSDDEEEQEEDQEQEQEQEQEDEDQENGGAVGDSDDDGDANGNGGDGEEGLTLLPSVAPAIPIAAKNAARKLGKKEVYRRANDIVRLALATEYKRGSLKRVDIIEKILGKEHARAFPFIFSRACKILRKSFGYELVELRARGTENEQLKAQSMPVASDGQKDQAEAEEEAEEEEEGGSNRKGKKKSAAAAKKKRKRDGEAEEEEGNTQTAPVQVKAPSTGSGTSSYILRSLLPPSLIATLSTPDEKLASVMNPDGDLTDVNGNELMKDSEGVMIDWKRSDGQLGGMGLLSVVLSLIMVSGRVISNNRLHAYLRRLGLDRKTFLPSSLQPDGLQYDPSRRNSVAQTQSSQSQSSSSFGGIGASGVSGGPLTLDNFLSLLVRQGYLEKVKDAISNPTQTQSGAGGGRRGRRSAANNEEGEINNVEWKWGSRAELEIGEQALVGFMGEILKEDDDDIDDEDEEEEEERTQASGRKKKSKNSQKNRLSKEERIQKKKEEREKKLQRDVERAAGSALIV